MTQKHFIAIAKIIKSQVDSYEIVAKYPHAKEAAEGGLGALKDTATAMADYFASINANFKRDRFMASCGFGDSTCDS